MNMRKRNFGWIATIMATIIGIVSVAAALIGKKAGD